MDIIIKNLSENNLKNINLLIPKNKLVVFTGVSGSGKSSVVFDTIASEAQRQLYEMYPFYIQSQLPQYKRPDVEQIQNLGAAIVVSQEALGGNARSTVGTATEIYTLLRFLYIAIGKPKLEKSSELSFNSQEGMCLKCSGLGQVLEININQIINPKKAGWKVAFWTQDFRLAERIGKMDVRMEDLIFTKSMNNYLKMKKIIIIW